MKVLLKMGFLLSVLVSFEVASKNYTSVRSTFFSDITFNENETVLNFRSQGPKYNFILYGNENETYGSVDYGQAIAIAKDQTIRLATRGTSIKIADLGNIQNDHKVYFDEWSSVNGRVMSYQEDLRSFGDGLREVIFIISINPTADLKNTLREKYSLMEGYVVLEQDNLLIIEKSL